jgi:hypothetical protein
MLDRHQSAVAEFMIMRGDPHTGEQIATATQITFRFVDVEFIAVLGDSCIDEDAACGFGGNP